MNWSAYFEDVNFARILVRPRATIREIVDHDPRDKVFAIVIFASLLGGVTGAILYRDPAAFATGPRPLPHLTLPAPWKIRAGMAIGLPILAVPFLYLRGAILRWTGGLLGGTAKAVQVRTAIAWSRVPSIVVGIPFLAWAIISPPPFPSPQLSFLSVMIQNSPRQLLSNVAFLYSFVIELYCLAEVHRFSAWRAIGAVALEWLIMFGTFLTIAILTALFFAILLIAFK